MTAADEQFEQLADHVDGRLSEQAQAEVHHLLDASPGVRLLETRLRRLINVLAMGALEAPPQRATRKANQCLRTARRRQTWTRFLETTQHLVASLTFDSRGTGAVAGFRRAHGATQLAYEVAGVRIDLQITAPAAQSNDEPRVHELRGQVMAPLIESSAEAVLVDTHSDQPIFATIDEQGGFLLAAAPGEYQLIVDVAAQEDLIVMQGLALK